MLVVGMKAVEDTTAIVAVGVTDDAAGRLHNRPVAVVNALKLFAADEAGDEGAIHAT